MLNSLDSETQNKIATAKEALKEAEDKFKISVVIYNKLQ
jgi:hypothetical protein